ncbi:MAG: hypothetical protein ACRDJ2_05290 [Actinomycetota bacterium]
MADAVAIRSAQQESFTVRREGRGLHRARACRHPLRLASASIHDKSVSARLEIPIGMHRRIEGEPRRVGRPHGVGDPVVTRGDRFGVAGGHLGDEEMIPQTTNEALAVRLVVGSTHHQRGMLALGRASLFEVHRPHEGELRTVGAPNGRSGAELDVGELAGLAPRCGDKENLSLRFGLSLGGKRDAATVRRPARGTIVGPRGERPSPPRAIRRHQPDPRNHRVRLPVGHGDDIRHLRAVGGELR